MCVLQLCTWVPWGLGCYGQCPLRGRNFNAALCDLGVSGLTGWIPSDGGAQCSPHVLLGCWVSEPIGGVQPSMFVCRFHWPAFHLKKRWMSAEQDLGGTLPVRSTFLRDVWEQQKCSAHWSPELWICVHHLSFPPCVVFFCIVHHEGCCSSQASISVEIFP